MRRLLLVCVAAAIACAVLPGLSAVPQIMSYQGVLTDDDGVPVPDGPYALTFAIYTVPTGGTELWSETQAVEVQEAIFDVLLGSVTPLDLPFDAPYWLGVRVAPAPESAPDVSALFSGLG